MTLLIHRGEGPWFRYAGQPVHILAGQDGQPPGFAAPPALTTARRPYWTLAFTSLSTQASRIPS
jgi:hypothetical protein